MLDYSILNEQQLKAVTTSSNCVLVSAGAGSGKTRVLTYRIAHLICDKHISPKNIVAVTFTNKAANEMKQRVQSMLGEDSIGITTSTFHSLCVRILREVADKIEGFNTNFSIYDDNDRYNTIKLICKENNNLNLDEKDIDGVYDYICHAKTFLNNNGYFTNQLNKELFEKIYELYQERLKSNNAFDFDDLLIKTYELLKNDEAILSFYQNRYKYILVDEFQDTSRLQYSIIKLLSASNKNVFVVGDEDQNIYTWRGSDSNNMQRFIKEFDNVEVIKLEQNYRSTKKILDTANKLITNNTNRIEKTLWTSNNDGVKVEFFKANSDDDEALYVARNIVALCSNSNYEYKDIAVLVRKNSLTRKIEEKLLNYNIDYNVFGGRKFYERAEIKNLLAYAKCLVNSSDDTNFLRIINFPKRSIGEVALDKFKMYANGQSLFDALMNMNSTSELDSKLLPKFTVLQNIFVNILNKQKTCGLYEIFDYIYQISGIKASLCTEKDEDKNRSENIEELLNSISEFEKINPTATIDDYLQSVSLISDIDSMNDDDNSITIATVHSVKGLEFKVVFVLALEENTFPHCFNGDVCDEQEERRLMYVAITRAMERLYLSYSQTRYLYNGLQYTVPSRFLKEIGLIQDRAAVIRSFSDSDYNYEGVSYEMPKSTNFSGSIKSFTSTTVESKSGKYSKGMRVYHIKFGDGFITNVDDSSRSLTIMFKGGIQKILTFDAPLKVL